MATVQQLLHLIDAMYPNGTSKADKVAFMNLGIDVLAPYFGNVLVDATLTTVANQDEYDFPTGLRDVAEIELLEIENQATPSDRYDYKRYILCRENESYRPTASYYQVYDDDGVKTLVLYPAPDTSGLAIHIRYKKRIAYLSENVLTAEPEFDSQYHFLLAIYACYKICSSGANPDTLQSDSFMQQFQSGLNMLWKLDMEQKVRYPKERRENRHWRRR